MVIGTESWLKVVVSNGEAFRFDFTTFRSDRSACGGGGGLSVLKVSLSVQFYG